MHRPVCQAEVQEQALTVPSAVLLAIIVNSGLVSLAGLISSF
ncbi:hypothetical protein [Streptomyces sp. NPDC127066]